MSNSSADASAVETPMLPRKPYMANGDSPHRRAEWVRAWWPVVIGIGVIALESTPWGGSDHTSEPLHKLYEFFFGPVSVDRWNHIHHYIRKSGHFMGYGLLCLTWLRAWRLSFPGFRFAKDAALAFLGTAMIASGDEMHQFFLPNRGSSPWDVLIDCSGAATMTVVAWLILRMFRSKPLP
jgi:VanZ family protein